MSTVWTPEEKSEIAARYQEIMQTNFDTDEERAAASVEITGQLAKEFNKTVNGARLILMGANVYIKASQAPAKAKAATASTSKRINKAEAQKDLSSVIASLGENLVDSDIIDKLTGKAALYFTGLLHQAIGE